MYVIAYDFGNYYAQLCRIEGMDPNTRQGGVIRSLLDPSGSNAHGIPSAFFWSAKVNGGAPVLGVEAERKSPQSNCIRYMKLHMGEQISLYSEFDDKGNPKGTPRVWSYDDIIVQTVQYQLNHANRELQRTTGHTTNKVALTYPAIFHSGQRAHLVSLVEKATLADGSHPKVVGTIMEPAAAALNYLAEQATNRETKVLVVDIGAGTLDLSLVEAYPQGRTYPNSKDRYYYDVKWNDGSAEVAGGIFTQRLFQYALKQVPFKLRKRQQDNLLADIEEAKRTLTDYKDTTVIVTGSDEDVEITLTRSKFEEVTKDLMDLVVTKIRAALNNAALPKPDKIVITGGASRMPMVARCIRESFPAFQNNVVCHKPGEDIAQGAARFATVERDPDVPGKDSERKNGIVQHTTFDIGIRYIDTERVGRPLFVKIMVPAGSAIPFTSELERSYTSCATQYSRFTIMEANRKNPDPYAVERDWREVVSAHKDHGRVVPEDTPSDSRITIDADNMVYVEVTNPNRPSAPPVRSEKSENLNLSNF